MRNTYTATATAFGRGLRAAVAPGCLSVIQPHSGTFAPNASMTAVPASPVFAASAMTTNDKPQGSHPPRATAALS